MLDFIKGDPQNPSGNLIAYCNVIGFNPIDSEAEYIVCNIMVSYLDAHDKNFPVVVFPPLAARNHRSLNKLFSLRADYDIIRIADFEIPFNLNEGKYVEQKLEELNHNVIQYVELCKGSYEMRELEGDIKEVNNKNVFVIHLSDEERTLIKLEKTLSNQDHPLFINEVPKLLQYIQKTYPRYDVHNLKKVINLSDKDLTNLYLEKFRAIFNEEYEQAAILQNKIHNHEKIS